MRESYPKKSRNLRNTPQIAEGIAELELVDTLQFDNLDMTQMIRWDYDRKRHSRRGSRLDHILATGYFRSEVAYSRVATSTISNHMMVTIEWMPDVEKQAPRWRILPSQ